jgi:hypothetical protein
MRCVQPKGDRGSLKWIQRAVERRSSELERPILDRIKGAGGIEWLSPLRNDDFAEYRDEAFLNRLDLTEHVLGLEQFWPKRGPQWDALGRTMSGEILLVEAKAHIGEFCSPASQASKDSLLMIRSSLKAAAMAIGVPASKAESWHGEFYQYCNRLAHLWWLRDQDIKAWLILVGFCGDADMPGDTTKEAWEAAYQVADFALGIPKNHPLKKYVVHVHPNVATLN